MTIDRLSAALADRYRIERELGQGGMATVYLAQDLKHDRKVALKVLRPELSIALGHERFLREITTTANLRHPNILPLYDSGRTDGQTDGRTVELFYYVMPYIEGESLRDRLAREEQLPLNDALRIACEVADALGYAHGRGVIHRDIKPENILLERGHAVVADFGIARAVSVVGADKLTQTGMAIGTPIYMSPEQSEGEGRVDGRSDLYSLGCMLYEMLAGEPPYSGPTALAIIAKRLLEPVPRISTLRATVSPALEAVLTRVLAKAPADRFATAEDFVAALTASSSSAPVRSASGAVRAAEGFRVAVPPFKYTGANADLTALTEGISEEIITGLSRFSYLRVVGRGATQGARYVLEGSLRHVGSRLRVAVQLLDAATGEHLWAEHYERTFSPDAVFELQDELVPRIVSTIADMNGVLPRSMADPLRSRAPEELTPHEAVLRSFAYPQHGTPDELARARAGLELAVESAPAQGDAWAMLAFLCVQDYAQGFDLQADSLHRGLRAAWRAVEVAPSSHLGYFSLAQALFFQREFQGFRNAVERAVALNPMDGNSLAFLGELLTHAGDRDRGLSLAGRAKQLNPHHPGWYWVADFFDAYRRRDYAAALGFALKDNMPGHWVMHAMRAAAYGQLGQAEAAAAAARDLLNVRPDFTAVAPPGMGRWWKPEFVEHMAEGWRKAGLDIPAEHPGVRLDGSI